MSVAGAVGSAMATDAEAAALRACFSEAIDSRVRTGSGGGASCPGTKWASGCVLALGRYAAEGDSESVQAGSSAKMGLVL